jgi:hypothetical protein
LATSTALIDFSSQHARRHGCEQRAILQQRRAAIARNHLVHRATKIDVDEIRPLPVDDLASCLTHAQTVCAEELDANRSLLISELGILPRSLIRLNDALRRDEFGHHHISSKLFANLAKNHIGHPGHRREVERKPVVGEPRQHARP